MKTKEKTDWIRFKPSLCSTCWATCCHKMAVQVSVPDLVRLELLNDEEVVSGLEEGVKHLQKAKWLRSSHPAPLVFLLTQKPNGDCVFLDEERRCTVYHKRPEICRQFPKIGPKPGCCPYRAKTEMPQ